MGTTGNSETGAERERPLQHWSPDRLPATIRELEAAHQEAILAWAKGVVATETEGLDELYGAISMIVKYIPNFMVVPLMVEHIRPRIAARVCIKMGVEQVTGYANDLPTDYFAEVSTHLEHPLLARILEKMKKSQVERYIQHALKHHPVYLFSVAGFLDRQLLTLIARNFSSSDFDDNPEYAPFQEIIVEIKALR